MQRLVWFKYSFMAIPLAMLGLPVYIYLPSYYAAEFAMSLSSIGSALLLARVLDVFTDPMIGYWSDRISGVISRKIQILLGSMLLLGLLILLFLPQLVLPLSSINWLQLFVVSFLSYFAWTLVQVPYLALAAETKFESGAEMDSELEKNQNHSTHQQNPLVSSREAMTIIGVLLMLLLPFILNLSVTESDFYIQFMLALTLLLVIALALISTTQTTQATSNQESASLKSKSQLNPLAQWRYLYKEHPQALVILKPYFLNNLANAIPATLFLIFVEDFLALKDQAGMFLLVYFLAGLIALPVWLEMAKRFGYLKVWRLSILISVLSFSLVFLLEPKEVNLYLLICILTGLSLTIDIAIPASIQTRIGEQIAAKTENMNGLLFGIWGMTTKLSLAVAVGLSLPLLDGLNQLTQINHINQLGLTENLNLLLLYALPAIALKTWVWWQLPKLESQLSTQATNKSKSIK